MVRAAITGLGFITSIGNEKSTVAQSLRRGLSGIRTFDELDVKESPVRLAGTVQGFSFPSRDFEEWKLPDGYDLTREEMRPMAPNSVYSFCAMKQAIADAGLDSTEVSNPRTGMLSASGGSMWLAYENYKQMERDGVMRCQPMAVVNSIPGSLYINLAALFKIKGPTLGFSSACSSSAHALGIAYDLVSQGRQDRVFVVGAEDCNRFSILPFAMVRALSVQTDPRLAPRPFDVKRDGFVGTGGAAVLVVENLELAKKRNAHVYAEMLGWGQSADGYHVLAPDPTGDGLARCMREALERSGLQPKQIDYINAHATSTPVGDVAEARAIRSVFNTGHSPLVSSTKALTGHGLSLAGAMEAGFSCLCLDEGFVPISANITELDPECAGVSIITKPVDCQPATVLSNSSGFGGTNVTIALRKASD